VERGDDTRALSTLSRIVVIGHDAVRGEDLGSGGLRVRLAIG
jgi:hypothetical protein